MPCPGGPGCLLWFAALPSQLPKRGPGATDATAGKCGGNKQFFISAQVEASLTGWDSHPQGECPLATSVGLPPALAPHQSFQSLEKRRVRDDGSVGVLYRRLSLCAQGSNRESHGDPVIA